MRGSGRRPVTRLPAVLAFAAALVPAAARGDPAPPASASSLPSSPPAASSAAASTAAASSAAAPPAPARVRLAYRAAEGCPGEPAFLDAVAAQARPFQRAPRSAARVRSIEASIRHRAGAFIGLLRVREPDGATSERDVSGATCGEVFSALSLVAAITIDTAPPDPRPPPPDPRPSPPPAPPPAPRRWAVATALLSGAFFSMASDASWGVVPTVQVSTPVGGVPVGVQLGAVLAASPRAATAAGDADFLWAGGRLAFSAALVTARWFSLHPTAGVDAGVVRGRGFAIRTPREQSVPWFDLSLGLRTEWMLLPPFGLDLAAGFLVPVTRTVWVFDAPDVAVHRTPPIGGYLTLGVRVLLAR